MSGPRRAPDGRFVPRTGDVALPPKPKQARDEHGQFIKQERVQSSKPYSNAVRELLEAAEGGLPEHWDNKNLTEAQSLASVHLSIAKAGNVQMGMMLIDRAEGKVPQAAEDREAAVAAGTGLRLLYEMLGIKVIDTTIVPQEEEPCREQPLLPSGSPEPGSSSELSGSTTSSETSSSEEHEPVEDSGLGGEEPVPPVEAD